MRELSARVTAGLIAVLVAAPLNAANSKDLGLAAAAVGLFAALSQAARSDIPVQQFRILSSGVATEPEFEEENSSAPGSPVFSVFSYDEYVTARFERGLALLMAGDLAVYCRPDQSVCWRDLDSDGVFDRQSEGKKLKAVILPYKAESIRLNKPSSGFRYELLYQGSTGGILRLLYREYVDDMVRPSFTQELLYDISSLPATLAFRDLKIDVLVADNLELRYRVTGEGAMWKSELKRDLLVH